MRGTQRPSRSRTIRSALHIEISIQPVIEVVLEPCVPRPGLWAARRAMLHLAVCGGLRVSELIGLRLNDVSLPSMSVRIYGKGRRERALPLWKSTTTALRAWLAVRGTPATPEVFVNLRGQPMSRWGVAYILKLHAQTAAQRCPGLLNKKLSPHVLRHYVAFRTMSRTFRFGPVS
jgi:integrase/recombinase XerD